MREFDEPKQLESLDPGSRDPGFWLRFHTRVMGKAQAELARRRMVGELSVVDVVFAWRRAVVPISLLAAALAGILILGYQPQVPVQIVALEEALTEDLNLLPIPAVILGEGPMQSGFFAVAEGGF